MRVVHESHCPDIGPICEQRPEPPQLHDQRFNLLELRLVGEYGLTERSGVELQVPLKISNTTVQYTRLDGTPFTPDYANIHHRNETLAGPGDPWLLARIAATAAGITFVGKAGASLPLGSTEPNPFELGDLGLSHQHVQLGTGIFAPIFIGDVSWMPGSRLRLAIHGQAHLMPYDNDRGYRAGNRYSAGLAASALLGRGFSLQVGGDVVNEQPERWNGVVLQDGNLGRTDVLLGASLTWRRGAYLLAGAVKVPVYQDIIQSDHEGGQLEYPAIVDVTVQRTFDVLGK